MSKKRSKHKQKSPSIAPSQSSHAAAAVKEPTGRSDDSNSPKVVKHLNVRFLTGLSIFLVVLGTGSYFLHGFQVKRSAHHLLTRAEEFVAAGKSEKAIELFGQYLKLNPQDTAIWAKLGGLIDELPPSQTGATLVRVYHIYSQVLREDPNIDGATAMRYRLVQLMMRINEYQQAEDQIRRLQKVLSSPTAATGADGNELPFDAANLYWLQGRCRKQQGNPEQAIVYYLAAVSRNPSKREYFADCIQTAQQLGNRIPRQDEIVTTVDRRKGPNPVADVDPQLIAVLPESLSKRNADQPDSGATKADTKTEATLAEQKTPAILADEIAKTAAQPLIDKLLGLMMEKVVPKYAAHLVKADYYLQINQVEAAAAEVAEAGSLAPREPEVMVYEIRADLMKCGNQLSNGDRPSAEQSLAKAVDLAEAGLKQDGTNLQFYVAMATARQQESAMAQTDDDRRSAIQKAERAITDAIEVLPKSREAKLKLADKEERTNELLKLNGIEIELPFLLAEIKLQTMETDDLDRDTFIDASQMVGELTKELEKKISNRGLIRYLTSWREFLHLREGYPMTNDARSPESARANSPASWSDVESDLRDARALLEDNPRLRRKVDLMLGQCERELQNPEARLALFREARRVDPTWREGWLEMARALEETGRTEEAFRQYGLMSQQYHLVAAPQAMLRLMIRRQLDRPEDEQNWDGIEATLADASTNMPNDVTYRLLDAEVKFHQKAFTLAEKELDALAARKDTTEEERLAILNAIIRFQLARDDQPETDRLNVAIATVVEARDQIGPRAEFAIAELSIAAAASPERLKSQAAETERSLDGYPRDERVKILEALTSVYQQLEDDAAMTAAFEKLAALSPDHLGYRLALAQQATQQSDEAAFQPNLREIRRIEGAGGPLGNVTEARWFTKLILDAENSANGTDSPAEKRLEWYQRALALLNQAEESRPQWVVIPLLKGTLAGTKLIDNRQLQYEAFRKAIDLGADDPTVFQVVIAHLKRENREQEVIGLLNRLRQDKPKALTPKLASELASAQFDVHNYQAAFDTTRLLAVGAKEYQRHLNEAYIKLVEYQLEQLRDAQSSKLPSLLSQMKAEFEQAVELAPEETRVWIAYVLAYRSLGDVESAEAVIARAQETIPSDPPVLKPFTLANCYELIGDVERARTEYDLAEKLEPDTPRIIGHLADFARRVNDPVNEGRYLQKLKSLVGDESTGLLSLIDDRLNALAARTGNYRDAERAIEQLEADLPTETPARVRNLVTQMEILQRYSVRPFRVKLIAVMEEIKRLDRLPLADQLSLASLYRDVNRPDAAYEAAQKLSNEHPQDLLIRAFLAELCVQQKKFEQAERELAQLNQSLRNSMLVLSLRSTIESDRGNRDAAAQLVADYYRSIEPTRQSELIFWETVSRTNYNLAFNWLSGVPGIAGTVDARRVSEGLRLIRKRDFDNALSMLNPVLELPEVQQQVHKSRIRECANLMSRFKHYAEAEAIYRDYLALSDDPNDLGPLVSLIGRQGDVERALDECDTALKTADPAQIISNAVTVLREVDHTSAQEARVSQMLTDALAKRPNDLLLLPILANFQDLQRKYVDAERTYKLILFQNGNHLLAINNLSWLLAMRDPTPERISEAKQLIEQAIDLTGPNSELLDTQATVEMVGGNAAEAADLLQTSIEESPSALKYLHLAEAQMYLSRSKEARETYKKAIELGLEEQSLHPLELPELERLRKEVIVRL